MVVQGKSIQFTALMRVKPGTPRAGTAFSMQYRLLKPILSSPDDKPALMDLIAAAYGVPLTLRLAAARLKIIGTLQYDLKYVFRDYPY